MIHARFAQKRLTPRLFKLESPLLSSAKTCKYSDDDHQANLDETLFNLIEMGANVKEVQTILHEGADPFGLVSCGHTIIGRAVQLSRYDVILCLLRAAQSRPIFFLADKENISFANESGSSSGRLRYNVQDSYKRTALHYAAEAGMVDIMCMLIGAGCKINVGDHEQLTPLHLACSRGHFEAVTCLLKFGCKHSLKTAACYEKVTALHIAASRGFLSIVIHLLESGAKVDALDSKDQTPLFVSVSRGHYDIAAALLAYGANPSAKQSQDYTPLLEAVGRRDARLVDLLLNNRASSALSHFLLHKAISQKDDVVACSLIRAGFSVNVRDFNGLTPLHVACQIGSPVIVEALLSAGADANACHLYSGETPLLRLVRCSHDLNSACLSTFNAILTALLCYGARIDKPACNKLGALGETPLKSAITAHKLDIVRWLLTQGSDPNCDHHRLDFATHYLHLGAEFLHLLALFGMDYWAFTNENLESARSRLEQEGAFAAFLDCLTQCRSHPMELRDLSRLEIRKNLLAERGEVLTNRIACLPVPEAVKNYLKFI